MSLKDSVMQRIHSTESKIWTPADFLDLSNYETVKKILQRLVNAHELRRIDRGLYDKPKINSLTGLPNPPDYRKLIEAIARRAQLRLLIDGMTCANDLGLTNAVPGQVLIHTDGRLRPIKLDNLIIRFKFTAPSKLYWAGRPGMRIIQSLYWLEDIIRNKDCSNADIIKTKLITLLQTSKQGKEIYTDLQAGLHTLPVWMQHWLRELLLSIEDQNLAIHHNHEKQPKTT